MKNLGIASAAILLVIDGKDYDQLHCTINVTNLPIV